MSIIAFHLSPSSLSGAPFDNQTSPADCFNMYACLNISLAICNMQGGGGVQQWNHPQMASLIMGGCSSLLTPSLLPLPVLFCTPCSRPAFTADFWMPLLNSHLHPRPVNTFPRGEFHNFSCANVMDRPDVLDPQLWQAAEEGPHHCGVAFVLHCSPFTDRQ